MTAASDRTVLVTGAAGEVGRRLVSRLARDGWRVRALVLPKDPLRARLDGTGAEIVEGDIRAPETLPPATAGVHAVAHLAAVILARDPRDYDAVNRRGTANLVAAAAAAGVRHFVYVSSASVVYPRLTPYGRAKLDAETIVAAETRLAHTIVRPTLVYDETGGQEFMLFRKYLRRFPVVPFVGPGAAKKRPVYSDDVVDGLARIVGNPVCFGKTYNLSGPEAITLRDLAKLVLQLEGASRPFLHVPLPVCRALAEVLSRVMPNPPLTPYAVAGFTNDADLDCGTATADFGYAPRGVREGLARSIAPDFKEESSR
ncbi:MAG TPA: NAD(P)H-binding protein [Polyangia bacterium]|nr:NAD(P)H-binding protein [Polyangia bacterium]